MQALSKARLKIIRSLLSRKGRDEHHAFIAEGVRVIRDGLKFGAALIDLCIRDDATGSAGVSELVSQCRERSSTCEPKDFAEICDTVTSQGVLATFRIPKTNWLESDGNLPNGPVLILDNIRDPGNLGTILRSAAAFGCGLVVAGDGTADPFSPKVVRGAMGATFTVPLHLGGGPTEVATALMNWGYAVWLLDAARATETAIWPPPPDPKIAFVLGGETEGLSPEWRNLSNGVIHIPQTDRVDSLNAAVAGSVVMARWWEGQGK